MPPLAVAFALTTMLCVPRDTASSASPSRKPSAHTAAVSQPPVSSTPSTHTRSSLTGVLADASTQGPRPASALLSETSALYQPTPAYGAAFAWRISGISDHGRVCGPRNGVQPPPVVLPLLLLLYQRPATGPLSPTLRGSQRMVQC